MLSQYAYFISDVPIKPKQIQHFKPTAAHDVIAQ